MKKIHSWAERYHDYGDIGRYFESIRTIMVSMRWSLDFMSGNLIFGKFTGIPGETVYIASFGRLNFQGPSILVYHQFNVLEPVKWFMAVDFWLDLKVNRFSSRDKIKLNDKNFEHSWAGFQNCVIWWQNSHIGSFFFRKYGILSFDFTQIWFGLDRGSDNSIIFQS